MNDIHYNHTVNDGPDTYVFCDMRSDLSFEFSGNGIVEGCALKQRAKRKIYGNYACCKKCKHRQEVDLRNIKIIVLDK